MMMLAICRGARQTNKHSRMHVLSLVSCHVAFVFTCCRLWKRIDSSGNQRETVKHVVLFSLAATGGGRGRNIKCGVLHMIWGAA